MTTERIRILFVCLGNICRSPSAEGVMRSIVQRRGLSERIEVSSAGTIGMHAGNLPDSRMRAAAAKRGYELKSRAKQITKTDLEEYDWVVTMDDENKNNVLKLTATKEQREKVRGLCEFCTRHSLLEVPDPYYGGAEGFELVLDLLEDGCEGLLNTLTDGKTG